MNRTSVVAGILAIVLAVAAIAIWALLCPSADQRILPARLICYTNDVTGINTGSYEDTNIAHIDFAVFKVDNPTGRSFFSPVGVVFSGDQSLQFRFNGGDFNLVAGQSATFAVPVPELRRWRCAFGLCPMDQGQSRWQALVWRASNLIGWERKSWVAASEEITK